MIEQTREKTLKDTKKLLDAIDDLLAAADRGTAACAAQVLRAMRGPDDDNKDLKHMSTTIIRHIAFPMSGSLFGFISIQPLPSKSCFLQALPQAHFEISIMHAVDALGIAWKLDSVV